MRINATDVIKISILIVFEIIMLFGYYDLSYSDNSMEIIIMDNNIY